MASLLQELEKENSMKQSTEHFYTGQTIYVTEGKFKGYKGLITDTHSSHKPCLHSVQLVRHEKEIALYETEIETVFSHDMNMLNEYKKVVKELS